MSCLPGDKCDYHPLTHFSGVVCAMSSVAAVAFTVHAWRGLQGYYAEQARKPGGYVRRKLLQTPLPLLLRILYLCASATQILGNTGLLWNNCERRQMTAQRSQDRGATFFCFPASHHLPCRAHCRRMSQGCT